MTLHLGNKDLITTVTNYRDTKLTVTISVQDLNVTPSMLCSFAHFAGLFLLPVPNVPLAILVYEGFVVDQIVPVGLEIVPVGVTPVGSLFYVPSILPSTRGFVTVGAPKCICYGAIKVQRVFAFTELVKW